MHLVPRDLDKLTLHAIGFLAQKRLWRGLRLNLPEATGLIAAQLLEWIRDGESVESLMLKGKSILGESDVMPGVSGLLHEVQIEGTFPDGTKLVTVHQPICMPQGDLQLALYGSGLNVNEAIENRQARRKQEKLGEENNPGAIQVGDGDIELNRGREAIELEVTNTGDRPIQVGSHYPFFETNAALSFARKESFGRRLDIPSGTAVRFEPGETRRIRLIEISGRKRVFGGNQFTQGEASPATLTGALARARAEGAQGA